MSKFENIWRLMEQHTFVLVPDSLNEDLKCQLCKKLMIDACQTACGCQYCFKCIEEYTKDEETYCPGGKDGCMEELLILKRDVMRNIRVNNKIYKLSVLCPNERCQSKIELKNMENHLSVCTNGVSVCPYETLGCGKIENHVNSDTFSHTQLVVEWINNLRNEIDAFNDKVSSSKFDIESLKEKYGSKEVQFSEIEGNIKQLLEEMQEKLTNAICQINLQQREMEIVKEKLRQQNNKIEALGTELEEVRSATDAKLTAILERFDTKKKEAEEKVADVTMKDDLQKRMDALAKEVKAVRVEIDSAHSAFKIGEPLQTGQPQNKGVDFTWKIPNIYKTWNPVFSEGFYSQGYKFCLSTYCNIHFASVWCYIIKGNNDSTLPWPMMHPVTISVVDPRTSMPYKKVTFHHDTYNYEYAGAFYRPLAKRNIYAIGKSSFLIFSKISDLDSIIVNDVMVVTCSIG